MINLGNLSFSKSFLAVVAVILTVAFLLLITIPSVSLELFHDPQDVFVVGKWHEVEEFVVGFDYQPTYRSGKGNVDVDGFVDATVLCRDRVRVTDDQVEYTMCNPDIMDLSEYGYWYHDIATDYIIVTNDLDGTETHAFTTSKDIWDTLVLHNRYRIVVEEGEIIGVVR